jgi:YVTN family beta-propeller protein
METDSVLVIDTATNTAVAVVFVGDGPSDVAVSPDGARAYVANRFSNDVSVIDTDTNTVVDTIGVGGSPWGATVSSDSSRVYVPEADSDTVSVIDTAMKAVIDTIAVGPVPSTWPSCPAEPGPTCPTNRTTRCRSSTWPPTP